MNRQMFFVFLLVAGILLTISEVEGNFVRFVRVRTPLRRKREINGLPGNGLGMGPRFPPPDYNG